MRDWFNCGNFSVGSQFDGFVAAVENTTHCHVIDWCVERSGADQSSMWIWWQVVEHALTFDLGW